MKNETQLSQEETDTLMQFAAQYMQTEAPRKISGRTRRTAKNQGWSAAELARKWRIRPKLHR